MIRLIRFFFIIKSYAAVSPVRNTPIVPGTGYRQSGLRIARNPPLRAVPASRPTPSPARENHPAAGSGSAVTPPAIPCQDA